MFLLSHAATHTASFYFNFTYIIYSYYGSVRWYGQNLRPSWIQIVCTDCTSTCTIVNDCDGERKRGWYLMLDTGRCWLHVFASFLLILFSIAFYVTFTTFFKSVASHSYVLLLLYAQLVVCEVIAVFHFRFLNRTYQRIYRISTECINGVINDRGTIVYLCFLRVRCGKRHRHEKYVVNYSVWRLLRIDRENNRKYQTNKQIIDVA